MSASFSPEPSKIQIDIRLAFLREYLADMRHAQQLFQSTVSTYVIVVGALIAGQPGIRAFFPRFSPVYGYLITIPFVLTAFALKNALIADQSKDWASEQKEVLEAAGEIKSAKHINTGIIIAVFNLHFYYFGGVSSRMAFILLMVAADCFCFYYLSLT